MVGVDELIDLFRGDKDTHGYAHPEIVIEICSRSGEDITPTVDWVWGIIYPDKKKEDIPLEIQDIIVSGVKLWYRRGSRRRT